MAIIVAGKLTIKCGQREAFIKASLAAILEARAHPACEDFAVSADSLDENRVNIFEKWKNADALEAFRNSGEKSTIFQLVDAFDVHQYTV